ncbi:MAG: hypothetical protein M3Y59_16795 [Myxococcota bacterium]|nr:hypothetical protein [Myxococcota bacterium]
MVDARWEAVAALAGRQSGLVTREQGLAAGYGENAWFRLVNSRTVTQIHRGLYQVRSPEDEQQPRDVYSALLLCGDKAVISHRTAARLHRFWGVDGFPLELTLPGRVVAVPPQVVAHRGEVPTGDTCLVRGLRLTTPARTLLDLAPKLDPVHLAIMLEAARRRDRTLVSTLRERLPGSVLSSNLQRTFHGLLADCDRRPRPMDSPFELQFWHRWPFTGLPSPTPQFEVRDKRGRMYVDFAWPEQKVAVETMGYGTRKTDESFNEDARRAGRLIELGWQVVQITYAMFCEDFFSGVRRSIARALTSRGGGR